MALAAKPTSLPLPPRLTPRNITPPPNPPAPAPAPPQPNVEFSRVDTLESIPCLKTPPGATLWDALEQPEAAGSAVFTGKMHPEGIRHPGHVRAPRTPRTRWPERPLPRPPCAAPSSPGVEILRGRSAAARAPARPATCIWVDGCPHPPRHPPARQAEVRPPTDGERHDGTSIAECGRPGLWNCSFRGVCLRSFWGKAESRAEEEGKCLCFPNHIGDACELGFGTDGWCFNACKGRGQCVMGTCVCQPGFWCEEEPRNPPQQPVARPAPCT